MHKFAANPVDAAALLIKPTLRSYVNQARKIAETPDAIKVWETGNYKEYIAKQTLGLNVWSPHYFGGAIEFLAESYFQYFGALHNLNGIRSVDDFDSTEKDGGIDHFAKTSKEKRFNGTRRIAKVGAPVYIQTKGTTNFNKTYKTNDGARIPNFFMNAFQRAIHEGHAYQARYIIFTTGKDIHYLLDENSGKMVEVVNSKKISKAIDGNVDFFNSMRIKLGLAEEELPTSKPDAISEVFLQENAQ